MIPGTPSSTLFPYTTLFRSEGAPVGRGLAGAGDPAQHQRALDLHLGHLAGRSEEHTSELQSLRQLVCSVLLEKKKQHDIHDRKLTSGHSSSRLYQNVI